MHTEIILCNNTNFYTIRKLEGKNTGYLCTFYRLMLNEDF